MCDDDNRHCLFFQFSSPQCLLHWSDRAFAIQLFQDILLKSYELKPQVCCLQILILLCQFIVFLFQGILPFRKFQKAYNANSGQFDINTTSHHPDYKAYYPLVAMMHVNIFVIQFSLTRDIVNNTQLARMFQILPVQSMYRLYIGICYSVIQIIVYTSNFSCYCGLYVAFQT